MCTALIIVSMVVVKEKSESASFKNVKVITPFVSDIYDSVNLNGTLVSADIENIFVSEASQIEEVYCKVGDTVSKGQLLMAVTPSNSKEKIKQSVFNELKLFINDLNGNLAGGALDGFYENDFASVFSSLGENNESKDTKFIYSGMDGVIMNILGEKGDTVSGFFPCVKISDPNKLVVSAQISENNISSIETGLKCIVDIEALRENNLSGVVSKVMPYAKQGDILGQSSEVKTEIEIDILSSSEALKPGYSAFIQIITDTRENAVLVPYEAINQDDEGREYVFSVENAKAKQYFIETGSELDEYVEVISGISPNMCIIADCSNIFPGDNIKQEWYADEISR